MGYFNNTDIDIDEEFITKVDQFPWVALLKYRNGNVTIYRLLLMVSLDATGRSSPLIIVMNKLPYFVLSERSTVYDLLCLSLSYFQSMTIRQAFSVGAFSFMIDTWSLPHIVS